MIYDIDYLTIESRGRDQERLPGMFLRSDGGMIDIDYLIVNRKWDMQLKKVRWLKGLEILSISHPSIVAQKVGNGIKTGAPTISARFLILTFNNNISC